MGNAILVPALTFCRLKVLVGLKRVKLVCKLLVGELVNCSIETQAKEYEGGAENIGFSDSYSYHLRVATYQHKLSEV
ncbi:hypothetical protein VNO80_28909 [Phaseolus coccineus]|uniref:Uncharacterized protein n=1 Tax=Phaseolus coccineus TaxID=3886 RepID=A0AAN9LAG2_PHACN